jgi:mercuric ion transport protein
MKKENKANQGIITGVLAALAASSCCIPPVVAAIVGVGGASSNLLWMEPLRPYLIGLAVIAISFAWYAHFKPKKGDDCGCEVEKPRFYQTKGFLIGMTLFAGLAVGFPYYSGSLFPENKKEVIVVNPSNIQKINLKITGMTCDACQQHVNHAVNELVGIIEVKTSYTDGNTVVKFESSQIGVEEIEQAVNSTGYVVTKIEKE